nr:hypothetical protein [Citrobacter portucalensis]
MLSTGQKCPELVGGEGSTEWKNPELIWDKRCVHEKTPY